MKILNFFMMPVFPVSAGNQFVTYEMNRYLSSRGHTVSLAYMDYQSCGSQPHEAPREPFAEIKPLPSPLSNPLLGIPKKVLNRLWEFAGMSPLIAPFIFSNKNRRQLHDMIENGKYDVLIVHYVFAGRFLEEFNVPGTRTVLFPHNLQFQLLEKCPPRALFKGIGRAGDHKAIEYRIFRKFDRLLMLGDYERDILLQDGFDSSRILLCGIAANVVPELSHRARKYDLLFAAGISDHNVHAIRWFLEKVWPGVLDHRPTCKLACAGPICREGFLRDARNVELLGFVPDLGPVHDESGIVINPVHLGVGVKVKVVEALGRGCAVLTTTNGAEGIPAPPGHAILVSDDPDEWVALILKYLSSEVSLHRIRFNALAWAQKNLRHETVFTQLIEWLEYMPHRNQR